jgi:acyl carrier protein
MKEKIKNIILEKFNLENINEDTNLSELAEDSFGKVELLFEVEEVIGKKLNEEEILQIETLSDLFEVVEKQSI